MPNYVPSSNRYDSMTYRRCGQSGIRLPELSLGLWHNFGGTRRQMRNERLFSRPSIWASLISIWLTTTVHPGFRRKQFWQDLEEGPSRIP